MAFVVVILSILFILSDSCRAACRNQRVNSILAF